MSNLTISAPEGNSISTIEAGTYPAVCIAIVDIGEQYNKFYDKYTRKVIFQFEIPSETIIIDGEEKPRIISETYTASLAEKATLRNVLESWRGREFSQDELACFDLENVLGAPCMLNIIHSENSKGNTFAKIKTITRLPKGFEVSTETEKKIYSLNDPDALEKLETLPEWIQNRIKESNNYTALTATFTEIDDEDLPF